MKTPFGTDRARGRTASSTSSWSMPPQRPFAQRKPAAPRGLPVTMSAPAAVVPAVQRELDEEQQEVFNTLPGLIAEQPLEALKLLDGLDGTDFPAFVAELSSGDFEALMTQVRGDSMGLQPFAQPYADLIGDIRHERIAATAEGMEESFDWIASGLSSNLTPALQGRNRQSDDDGYKTNHFTTWIVKNGAEPTKESSMNCWESCLFAGYKAGILPKSALVTIYLEAVKRTQATARAEMKKIADEQGVTPTLEMVSKPVNDAYQDALGVFLGANEAEPLPEDALPPRGYLLFFNGVSHVALSLGSEKDGSPEVMSLWYLPGPQPKLMRTTLKDLLKNAVSHYDVTMGPVPW